MGRPIGGTAFLTVDGQQYDLRGNWTVSPDMIEREGVAGQDTVHGYIERPRVPWMQGDISDNGELSLDAVRRINNATVTLQLNNGKVYILRNAWSAEARELNTSDAQMQVRFEGMSSQEITA